MWQDHQGLGVKLGSDSIVFPHGGGWVGPVSSRACLGGSSADVGARSVSRRVGRPVSVVSPTPSATPGRGPASRWWGATVTRVTVPPTGLFVSTPSVGSPLWWKRRWVRPVHPELKE